MGIQEAWIVKCDNCNVEKILIGINPHIGINQLMSMGWTRPNIQLFYCPECSGDE